MTLFEPMRFHTSLQVGGLADCYIEPQHIRDLETIYEYAQENGHPITVIGAGTNLLISDAGIRGIVLSLKEGFSGFSIDHHRLLVQSGFLLGRLLSISHQHGLTGLGFMAGIPGTVGGCIYMNAGTSSQYIGNLIKKGITWDPKTNVISILMQDDFHFNYRYSCLQSDHSILLEAELELSQGDVEEELQLIKLSKEKRYRTQPLDYPNAGCTWKNPLHQSAGKLIEEAGLKGKMIGEAMVSPVHGNFIINLGKASCRDILALMELVEKTVFKRYNILLERELQVIE